MGGYHAGLIFLLFSFYFFLLFLFPPVLSFSHHPLIYICMALYETETEFINVRGKSSKGSIQFMLKSVLVNTTTSSSLVIAVPFATHTIEKSFLFDILDVA